MSRSKTSRVSRESSEAEEDLTEPIEEDAVLPETETELKAAPKPPAAPVGREMTAREYVRGLGPLGVAFQTTVGLESKRTVKLTKSQWDAKYHEFVTQPRR